MLHINQCEKSNCHNFAKLTLNSLQLSFINYTICVYEVRQTGKKTLSNVLYVTQCHASQSQKLWVYLEVKFFFVLSLLCSFYLLFWLLCFLCSTLLVNVTGSYTEDEQKLSSVTSSPYLGSFSGIRCSPRLLQFLCNFFQWWIRTGLLMLS